MPHTPWKDAKHNVNRRQDILRNPYSLIEDWKCPIGGEAFHSEECPHTLVEVKEYNDAWLSRNGS